LPQLLISKLDQKKVVVKVEDRAKIMQTLSSLTQIITKLQQEIKAASSSSGHPIRVNKTKAQVSRTPSSRSSMPPHVHT